MAKASMQLDPDAQSYTDDEIVGKVNSAAVNVTRANAVESAAVDLSGKDSDDLSEGVTNKYDTGIPPSDLDDVPDSATRKAMADTEKTKLTGIEDNAKDDQTGTEVQTAILALSDGDRKLIKTDPQSGEFNVLALQRDAAGKLDVDFDDVAV